MVVFLLSPDQSSGIKVGLVDLDQSKETKMIVQLIEESSQLGSYLQIQSMDEAKAKQQIKADNISAFIVLPAAFTDDLYHGTPVNIKVAGNPKKQTDSRLVKQLIDSVARHISTSQANILTIDQYAKKLGMSDDDRRQLMFKQFQTFLLYVIGKDQMLSEEKITNQTTASPVPYFAITGWFVVTTIWFLLVFQLLYRQAGAKMKQRMRLYGVSSMQQHISRLVVTLSVVTACSMLVLYGIANITHITLEFADYRRILGIILLYGICLLEILAVLENIISSEKLALVIQYVLVFALLIASGAIVPIIYFSLQLQHWLAYVFGNHALHWLQQITMQQRMYADLSVLLWSAMAGALLLVASSAWKERRQL